MKHTFLILAVAAQFAGGLAVAQTADTTAPDATGTMTGTFGSDWSSTMGTAMMGDDGMTVRSAAEIGTQFETLSDEDKDMLRRDCMVHMQTMGAADATAGTDAAAAPDATAGATETAPADGAVAGDTTATTGTEGAVGISVTAGQMDEICAATKDM